MRGGGDAGDAAVIHGFVLMLDNITRDFEQDSARDQLLHGLTEGSRASLGNLQAAVEMLDDPDLDAAHARAFPGRRARRGRRDEPAHPGPGRAQPRRT